MTNDDRMDDLIGDVAREITSAPVDEGLARRVSARIRDVEAAPHGWPRSWLLAPAAAAVVLAAAMLVTRETRKPVAGPSVPSVQSKPNVLRQDPPAAHETTATTVATAAPRAVATVVSSRPPAPIRAARPVGPDVEPLSLTPIVMDAVDVSPLVVVMPIEISAIAIDRIEVPAMP
jgi:hypothetical protein